MITKATRVLTYIGPEEWIKITFEGNEVKGSKIYEIPDCKIVEESITYHHSELLPNEIPVGSVPAESPMLQPTAYAVGIEQDKGIRQISGPSTLSEVLNRVAEYPNEYIYQLINGEEPQAIMRWNETIENWVAL